MKYFKVTLLLFGLLFCLQSCQKDELSTNMEATIYLRNGAADMPAYIYGNGASKVFILLLHGGPGGNGLGYRIGDYYQPLEEDYAMVYWDQRGQGMSHGNLVGSNKISLELIVEDLHQLILLLKHQYGEDISVFLMGHSWGGTVGSKYMTTENYQADVKGWIEVDGAHDFSTMGKEVVKMINLIGNDEIDNGRNVGNWQGMIDYGEGLDTNRISRDELIQLNTYGHGIESDELLSAINKRSDVNVGNYLFFTPANPLTSAITGSFTNSELTDQGILNLNLSNDLSKITTPSLVLWGRYDFVIPPVFAEDAFEKIGTTEKHLVYFENSAHSPMMNEPDEFVTAVKDFVELYK